MLLEKELGVLHLDWQAAGRELARASDTSKPTPSTHHQQSHTYSNKATPLLAPLPMGQGGTIFFQTTTLGLESQSFKQK